MSVLELARRVTEIAGSSSDIVFVDRPGDDCANRIASRWSGPSWAT